MSEEEMSRIANRIYLGDNLKILKRFPNKCIDLIYLDPPFFTQTERLTSKSGYIYNDKWNNIKEYLRFIIKRVKECHRVLKSTGSFYLHCDWHANAPLRILCDKIFDYNFRNEIIWCYKTPSSSKNFPRKHDTIFRYSKTDICVFNFDDIRIPYGIWPKGKQSYKTKSFGLEISKEIQLNPNGKLCLDWWTDIPIIGSSAKERLGYPTQKPEALLERIIKVSSNEGDIVLDPFCGSGTTCVVAIKLNRRFIGIDNNPDAVKLTKKRLEMPIIYNKIENEIEPLI